MRRYQLLLVLWTVLLGHSSFIACGQALDPKSFEENVQRVVKKVSSACVRISRYDSTGHRRFGSFSGVVVTADGYVLSAAHATVTGASYLVELPDGKKYRGTALGRVAAVDAAMIKIDTAKNPLPFCEIGWSYDLKVNQPCLSIAYPASLNELKSPVLRLGHIVRIITPEGKMQTTCLMEPGDSGGPVFDLYGRVIGLHSKIESPLTVNLENPIDNYRKYWSSLKKKVDYGDDYPDPETPGTDPLEERAGQVSSTIPYPQILKSVGSKYQRYCVGIKSSLGSVGLGAFGTVVRLKSNSKTIYVVSKSSIVGDQPVLTTADFKTLAATVIKRDQENDLVLLKAVGLKEGVALNREEPGLLHQKEGEFLVSPSFKDSVRIGVLGNDSVEVKTMTRPVLGIIAAAPDSNTVKIIGFSVSIVQKYGLDVDDLIDSLNGVPVTSAKQLISYVSGRKPGDEATYEVIRANKKIRIHSVFQKMPKAVNKHVADTFDGGMSLRNEGFNWVFVHDSLVRPEECGGPVFNLHGDFCGINIARISRTSTIALPVAVVSAFVSSAM